MPSENSSDLDPRWEGRLLQELAALLAAGWRPGQIAQRANLKTWSGVAHTSSALRTRLERLRQEPGPGTTTARPGAGAGRREWCGECDETTRLRETSTGAMERCPRCHQLKAAGLAAAMAL